MLTPEETDPIFADLFGMSETEGQSHDLCLEIDTAAGAGDAVKITELLNDFKENPNRHDECVVRLMLGNTFRRSCENGYVECAKILLSYVDTPHIFHALLGAGRNGHAQVLELLLPLYKWENAYTKKSVLCATVSGQSIKAVKTVLPYVTNKTHRTEALRVACQVNNQDVFDVLYPLSNPQSALKYMENRKMVSEREKQMLKDAIAAQEQKKVLSEAVSAAGGAKRKMKI